MNSRIGWTRKSEYTSSSPLVNMFMQISMLISLFVARGFASPRANAYKNVGASLGSPAKESEYLRIC
jgi:hypothetical protein